MKLPVDKLTPLRARFEGRQVCVTGGAGFIGGHIVDALLSLGAGITVIDDLSNSTPEHIGSLIDMDPERVRFVHASILDDEALDEAMSPLAGTGIVFHLGALGSVPRSLEEPGRYWSVNATGTVRVLEAARRARAARVVYSASSSAYGEPPLATNGHAGGHTPARPASAPRTESMAPSPVSPYGASKAAGELACLSWAQSFGLSTVSLRYFNIFGPRQPADSAYAAVVASFAKRLLAGEPPVIYGDGAQSRDFTFVANAVFANLLAGASERPLRGEVVNIGTGRSTSVLELAGVMARACGAPEIRPVHKPARHGEVLHSLADITAARALLGYEPLVDLEAGLTETVAWYREALAGNA